MGCKNREKRLEKALSRDEIGEENGREECGVE
jgi:hypothetical protein